jgi:hypothetical protein
VVPRAGVNGYPYHVLTFSHVDLLVNLFVLDE